MADDAAAQSTLVERLYGECKALTTAAAAPQSDEQMSKTLDALFATVSRLAHAPALSATDLDHKLEVLCHRLREHLDPDDRGAVLTYLLAEAIRDEHLRLARPAAVETAP